MNVGVKRPWLFMVAPFLIVVLFWAGSYHPSEFKGGVGIRDSGVFSYPRYHAQLGALPLWKNGTYQFTVRGLPPDLLDLVLQVPDARGADREELMSLSTSVSASIADSSGKEVCTAAGSLSDARRRGPSSWVLASSSLHASFWHPRCQQLPISRFKTYTVKVTVSEADPRSPQRMITPILQGGGVELP